MLRKIRGLLRHIKRRYPFTLITSVPLLGLFMMIIKYQDKSVSPYIFKLLIAVNLLFLFVSFVNLYRDKRNYKERVSNLKDYRYQTNQLRRQQAEYNRQIAKLGGNSLGNPLHELDNEQPQAHKPQ
jgi:hypothetical protein